MPAPTSFTVIALEMVPAQGVARSGLQDALVSYRFNTGEVYHVRVQDETLALPVVRAAVLAHARAVATILGATVALP